METITIYDYNIFKRVTTDELQDLKSSGCLIKYSNYEDCYINCDTSDYGIYYDADVVTGYTITGEDLIYCEDTMDYRDRYDTLHLEDREYYVSENYDYCWQCDHCGNYFSNDAERHHYDGCSYCNDCWDDEKPVIYDYHCYNDGYAPRTHSPRDQPLYMGFELEVDNVRIDETTLAERVLDGSPDGVLHCEYDSSVAFEFISQPCTLEYHKHQHYQDWLFSELIGNCESHDAGTCGLHVHVNKSFFDDRGYSRLKTILFFFKEELFQFSRRQCWDYEYSDFDEKIEKDKVTISGSKARKKAGHHTWFNENSGNTYEFRFFRGTLKFKTFMATLELVHNICAAAMSDKDIITWDDLITPGDYCQEYSNTRSINCDAVLDFFVLEEGEKKQRKELDYFLNRWVFMNGSNIVIGELIGDYIYLYSPYMLDCCKLKRKSIGKLSLDHLGITIMSENGYIPVCDRQALNKLFGGVL